MGVDITTDIITICHCYVGFALDNSTGNFTFPHTGVCVDLRDQSICDPSLEAHNAPHGACYEDDDEWGVCPYCHAYKHHEDHGGILSLGEYVSGEGTYDDDPMVFEGGSSTNCATERSSIAFWYCWYNAYPNIIVDLHHVELFWGEDPLCSYQVYIYTPLACDWALP